LEWLISNPGFMGGLQQVVGVTLAESIVRFQRRLDQPIDGRSALRWSELLQQLPVGDSILHANYLQEVESLLGQLRASEQMRSFPIIAITGLLNAGKSSLLASFLSPQGRRRVLIGQGSDQGTHRFVLWVPASWQQDSSSWRMLTDRMQQLFGGKIEQLAEDSAVAFQQYNGHVVPSLLIDGGDPVSQADADPLTIPLIAWDSMLDQWGVAIMDCPDIQTGLLPEEMTAQKASEHQGTPREGLTADASRLAATYRSKIMERAMRVSSTFLVVAGANNLHDQSLAQLLQGMQQEMAGIERWLLINRVPRRYRIEEIAVEITPSIDRFGLQRVYMAYHFDGPHQRERLPKEPLGLDVGDVALPVFVELYPRRSPQPPDVIPETQYLNDLGRQLDRSQLWRDQQGSLMEQLRERLVDARKEFTQQQAKKHQLVHRLQRSLAIASYEFSLDPKKTTGEVRLHASQEIIQQVSRSLERTAPWWAKPSRLVLRIAESTKQQWTQLSKRLNPMKMLEDQSRQVFQGVQEKLHRGELGQVISAAALAEPLRRDLGHLQLVPSGPSAVELDRRCQQMIDRFQVQSKARGDDQELDRLTEEVWKAMSWKQRLWNGVVPASLLFAPLLAVIALPFDMGGSSVLVLASIKELLVAGVAGVGIAMFNRDQLPQLAESHVAWQQWSDLFLVGCDELGLPRPAPSEAARLSWQGTQLKLQASEIPIESRNPLPGVQLPIELADKDFSEILKALETLEKEWQDDAT
jgi:hypothetical protein